MKRIGLALGVVLLAGLMVAACDNNQGPVPTMTMVIANEWDADDYLVGHIRNLATTYHGKQVLAEMVDGLGHGPSRQNSDGSWEVALWLDDFEVNGNSLLEPVFRNPMRYYSNDGGKSYVAVAPGNKEYGVSLGYGDLGVRYIMEWNISANGLVITPVDGNAIRLDAELRK